MRSLPSVAVIAAIFIAPMLAQQPVPKMTELFPKQSFAASKLTPEDKQQLATAISTSPNECFAGMDQQERLDAGAGQGSRCLHDWKVPRHSGKAQQRCVWNRSPELQRVLFADRQLRILDFRETSFRCPISQPAGDRHGADPRHSPRLDTRTSRPGSQRTRLSLNVVAPPLRIRRTEV